MDGMTAKEFLLQPARARVRLEMALLRRDALKSLTERVTQTFGIQTTGGHSPNCNAMEDAVIRLTEAEEMVEKKMKELAEAELEVGMVLAMIPDKTLNEYMVKRYLENQSIRKASEEMNFTKGWGEKKQRKGIEAVQRILDEKGYASIRKVYAP